MTPWTIGLRGSSLSLAQLKELEGLLQEAGITIELAPHLVETAGDKDLSLSLRTAESDLFTQEIDELQLEGTVRLALHSAKDLPDPLPAGLEIAALTRGLDPGDALVLREGESLLRLPPNSLIATSSDRRTAAVKELRSDLLFKDIRGKIHQRLEYLYSGEVDGVVIAEAALIRLSLTHLNRIRLPGPTTPLQGQLAVICREEDEEARLLFAKLDTRRATRILYFGLNPTYFAQSVARNCRLFHYPLITIHPTSANDPALKKALEEMERFTHIIFTSKTAARRLVDLVPLERLQQKSLIAIGRVTAAVLDGLGLKVSSIAEDESAEGLIDTLDVATLRAGYTLWPHSARSRRLIADFFIVNKIPFCEALLYDTLPNLPFPPPDLGSIDQFIFTSPSTVDAFLRIYPSLPTHGQIAAQGEITRRYLSRLL